MARAIALGAAVRRRTAPNPWVGCVIVRDGVIVGEGATGEPGGPHAEVVALRAAGGRARGAVAYISLEPCNHTGRTGPCVDALLASGVRRVVVATTDPDPRVAGRGLARLEASGVDVVLGPGRAQAEAVLAPYLHHRRTGRPYIVLKTALSIDGRTAAPDGSSRWITGEAARADAQSLRADSQAVLVGAGTAIADRPRLTVRLGPHDTAQEGMPGRPPTRVVLDSRGRVPAEGPLFDPTLAPTLVCTTDAAPAAAVEAWRAAGADVEVHRRGPDGVALDAVLASLAGRGVLQLLVEGGATVHGSFVAAGLVDRLVAYVGATLLGAAALPAIGWAGPVTLDEAPRFVCTDVRRLGCDVRLDYVPLAL